MLEYGLIIGLIIYYFYTVTCVFFSVQIARMKGRRRRWGWLGLFLGLIGVIIICFLPNAKGIVGETNPIKVLLKKITGISPLATGIIVAGLVLVVGGALVANWLTLYLENRSHEKELSAGGETQTVVTQSVIPEAIKGIFSSRGGSFAITEGGNLYGWGTLSLLSPDENGVLYKNAQKIEIEGDTCYLLAADGTLYAKGNNANSLIPGQTAAQVDQFVSIEKDVADFSLSETAAGILKKSGNLYMLGSNRYQQLGCSAEKVNDTENRVASEVAQVVVTNRSVVYLRKDGTVYGVGNNAYGQFGLGHQESVASPVQIASDCAAVAAGDDFVVLLKKDGTVWTAGNDSSGQLGREPAVAEETESSEENKEDTQKEEPYKFAQVVTLPEGINAIYAGGKSAFALIGETLYAWGENSFGQLGSGQEDLVLPEVVYRKVSALATDGTVTLLLSTDGKLLGAGDQRSGRLGDASGTGFREMAEVKGGEG